MNKKQLIFQKKNNYIFICHFQLNILNYIYQFFLMYFILMNIIIEGNNDTNNTERKLSKYEQEAIDILEEE